MPKKRNQLRADEENARQCFKLMREAELKVYFDLLLYRNNDKNSPDYGTAYPSEETLADDCNLSIRAVEEAISKLKKRGLIAVRQRVSCGSGWKYNVYYIHDACEVLIIPTL
jgi:predicted transcriptional regulator